MEKYEIVRNYHPALNKKARIIKRGLSLEEAQAHCRDPKTRKDNKLIKVVMFSDKK